MTDRSTPGPSQAEALFPLEALRPRRAGTIRGVGGLRREEPSEGTGGDLRESSTTASGSLSGKEGEVRSSLSGVSLSSREEKRRNHVWEALARRFGEPETKTEKSRRGKVARELKEAMAGLDGPSQGEEVERRARVLGTLWGPGITLTDTALLSHWTEAGRLATNGSAIPYYDPERDGPLT